MFEERQHINKIAPRRLVQGVGVNDAHYPVAYIDGKGKKQSCPYYKVWTGMLIRCYNKAFHSKRPTYASCTLEPDWLIFSNFKNWMQTQDWKGMQLDKDLLDWENKHYSPDTCLFIPQSLNNLLTLRRRCGNGLPLGVHRMYTNSSMYYIAACSFYGKQVRLGYFKTPEAAAEKYKEAKLKYIKELAEVQKDPRIRQALINLH